MRLLSGALDADRAGRAYSALAGALVAALLARVEAAFAAEHGRLAGGRVAVLAMGKLGSREMTAASDLDLIVIYDHAGEASDGSQAAGRRRLYYARLTQRLVAALTAPTKAGRLYDVDLRLRPSGRKGPLATSLAAFAHYQRRRGGDLGAYGADPRSRGRRRRRAGARHRRRRRPRRCASRASRAKLAREIRDMRALIAKEKGDKGAFDLKLAPGGLIDLEFLAQFLILAHADRHPELAQPETRETLRAATRAGLISAGEGEVLAEAHRLMTAVTQALRLTLPDDAAPRSRRLGRQAPHRRRRRRARLRAPDAPTSPRRARGCGRSSRGGCADDKGAGCG